MRAGLDREERLWGGIYPVPAPRAGQSPANRLARVGAPAGGGGEAGAGRQDPIGQRTPVLGGGFQAGKFGVKTPHWGCRKAEAGFSLGFGVVLPCPPEAGHLSELALSLGLVLGSLLALALVPVLAGFGS